jgi:tRNA(Ile)-lysidine synthase TilS/MesJ
LKFFIAYSGGVDSSYLVHFFTFYLDKIKQALNKKDIEIYFLFYNHNTTFSLECSTFTRQQVEQINLTENYYTNSTLKQFSGNLESEWRKARYAWFNEIIGEITNYKNPEDNYLVLGHHLTDNNVQALSSFFTGTKRKYIYPFQKSSYNNFGSLIRPLYLMDKNLDLYSYMNTRGLSYKEDPTNPYTSRGQLLSFYNQQIEKDERIPHVRWKEYVNFLTKNSFLPKDFKLKGYRNKNHSFWGQPIEDRTLQSLKYLLTPSNLG